MKVPSKVELQHMQLQAMLKEHCIPESELLYCGEREYRGDDTYSDEGTYG